MKKLLLSSVLILGIAASAAYAQNTGGSFATFAPRSAVANVQTLTAVPASTVASTTLLTTPGRAVSCIYNQSAHAGGSSPSVTWSIQGQDPNSATTWISLITSSAITTDTTSMLSAGLGVATTANVGAGVSLPQTLRTSVTVAGTSTPTVTAKIGCSFTN